MKNWPAYIEADHIEVALFTETEAISFLRRRVPALAVSREVGKGDDERRTIAAGRLAMALGNLPIAVEHAAAYLAETGQSADDYLIRFTENSDKLLSERPIGFSVSASATWTRSTVLLTPDAEHLFNLCAFLSPGPIAVEFFLRNAHAVSAPPGLRELLSSSTRFRAAASQLHRLSLAIVDGARDQIQIHRVIQAVTRHQLRQNRPDMFQAYRTAVDGLLAASNQGDIGDDDGTIAPEARGEKGRADKDSDTLPAAMPYLAGILTLPVTIYLSDASVHEQVEAAVDDLLAAVGFYVDERDDPELGSWFRRMRAAIGTAASSPAAREGALMAAHIADTRLVLAQDAAVTATLLANLGPVIASLQPTKDAVIRVGALLIVKVDWVVTVYQLTAAQQTVLDHRPDLATAPHEVTTILNMLGPDGEDAVQDRHIDWSDSLRSAERVSRRAYGRILLRDN